MTELKALLAAHAAAHEQAEVLSKNAANAVRAGACWADFRTEIYDAGRAAYAIASVIAWTPAEAWSDVVGKCEARLLLDGASPEAAQLSASIAQDVKILIPEDTLPLAA
jgi:hypothetical protein